MNSYFNPYDESARQFIPGPPFQPFLGPVPSAGFAYPDPQYLLSYQFQPSHYPVQNIPPMHQQYLGPLPSTLPSDPAFSPDPRYNLHFFSMNDREEIYPASPVDSASDYEPTVADSESEVDHHHLPPRMRFAANSNDNGVVSGQHIRSHSTPYIHATPSPQIHPRSLSTRVIPVPPPNFIAHTPIPNSAREEHVVKSPWGHVSASTAAQDHWQAPPSYSDADSDSSTSDSQAPLKSPPVSMRSQESQPHATTPSSRRRSPLEVQPTSSTLANPNGISHSGVDAPPPQTSSVRLSATRPVINPRSPSAPHLHPPHPVDVPSRPSTVPAPSTSAPLQSRRKSSMNPSISTPPRDLDSIDELDESDPLGFAWHHDGPYEAIAKATGSIPDASATLKKSSKRKPAQLYDSVSLGVVPGQIFPSASQYQPHVPGNGFQMDPNVLPPKPPPENFQVTSPPRSPLTLPVQRHALPDGHPPPTPDIYDNIHLNTTKTSRPPPLSLSVTVSEMRNSRTSLPALPSQEGRVSNLPSSYISASKYINVSHESLPNPYSALGPSFPDMYLNSNQKESNRPASMAQPRSDFPPSNVVPRPDISLPPGHQQKDKSKSLLPRHLPKKLVMPAPLQQNQTQNAQPAHLEFLAQRHAPSAPSLLSGTGSSVSVSGTTQQVRAKDIPISHGPKVLRKRNTGAQPEPSLTSNTTTAMFAAKVRFAEPRKDETKEERKKREKEEAKWEKEEAKREKEHSKLRLPPDAPLQGIFAVDYVKEAQLAKERDFTKGDASSKNPGRKLSKRR